jgi:hypothetical protein
MQSFYRGQQKSPKRFRNERRRSSLNEYETPPTHPVDNTPYWTWMKTVEEGSIPNTDLSRVVFAFGDIMAVSEHEMSVSKMWAWSKRLLHERDTNSFLTAEQVESRGNGHPAHR